ncbi:MAG: cupin domain-containing protein [Phycisphaerales bacterium]
MIEAPLIPKFVPAGEGRRLHAPGGDLLIPKIGCAESGNTFQLTENALVPGGGPPLHEHEHEDEAFYVLEGEVNFWVCEAGDRTGKTGKRVVATKGAFLFGPRGSAHTFKNCSEQPARMLILINPGANFEAFYEKIGKPGAAGDAPSDHEMMARIAKHTSEHGITVLGPSPL